MNLSHLDNKYRLLWRRGYQKLLISGSHSETGEESLPGHSKPVVSQPTENPGWSETCFNSQTAGSVPGWSLKNVQQRPLLCSWEFRRTSEETEAFWRGHQEMTPCTERNHVKKCQKCQIHEEWGWGGKEKKKPWWTPECSSGIKITLVVHSHTMLNMHNNNFQMERADTTQLSLDNPPNSKNYYFKALRFCFVLIFETKSHCVAPTGLKCKRFACLCFPNAPWD